MMHILRLMDIESALVRRLALIAHLPVIAAAFVLHLAEGAAAAVHNFVRGIIITASDVVQNAANHIVIGVITVARDMRNVWRGRVVAVETAVKPVKSAVVKVEAVAKTAEDSVAADAALLASQFQDKPNQAPVADAAAQQAQAQQQQ